ncbi:aspartic peptidase domain-containing protein [Suillus paluster]|uniref:aspartic peptidase domain-containing protein n=1 Tax=Suillus paluster TaxID=48578 RepID=UPI001B860843|nr:aspartic peptidase domain-containing protein [Suillus paluster]KAG1737554.1 aspartic peptidase domain-containing protein [Suillus paluster]
MSPSLVEQPLGPQLRVHIYCVLLSSQVRVPFFLHIQGQWLRILHPGRPPADSLAGYVSQDVPTIGDLTILTKVSSMSPSEADGGEATIGGIDYAVYTGSIAYVPVRRKAYWEVELEKVPFGNDELDLDQTGAIDTGESPLHPFILFPTDIAETLNTKIGGTKTWNGQYQVDFSQVPSLPDLTFYLSSKPYTLKGSAYVLEVQSTCISSFTDLDKPTWRFIIVDHSNVMCSSANITQFSTSVGSLLGSPRLCEDPNFI